MGESARSSTGESATRYARRFFLNTRGGEGRLGGAIGSIAGDTSGMEGSTSVDMEETGNGSIGRSSGECTGDSVGGLVNAEESNESKSYGCGEATGAAGVDGTISWDDDGEKRCETDVWNFFAKSEANECVIERADFISMERRVSSVATSARMCDDALS